MHVGGGEGGGGGNKKEEQTSAGLLALTGLFVYYSTDVMLKRTG